MSLIDLAAERLGARVVFTNDEFFAEASNLLRHGPAEWREGEYTDRGKWMDGWESRRRRVPGNDVCLIQLGAPGRIREASVATTFFRGNHPEACSIQGIWAPDARDADDGAKLLERGGWFPILDRHHLEGDSVHEFPANDAGPATHVRLDIFPDGGVARLRLRGSVVVDWPEIVAAGESVDLASIVLGGLVVSASDQAFGETLNLLLPGRASHMGEGWETRRRRGPGHDWVVVRLGHRGEIERIEIDTEHFKGNYPAEAVVELCDVVGREPDEDDWQVAVPRSVLGPDRLHEYGVPGDTARATHVRLSIYPDGGVARLRVFGTPVAAP
jgi:allantoicase